MGLIEKCVNVLIEVSCKEKIEIISIKENIKSSLKLIVVIDIYLNTI